eukprot:CAMPEP_0116872978 /NCGR_PEP_ID=MMETSP0463-20121206/3927_1 /TAXON_ID=181622 /ORGANISM="Strombidinopsis sp, Strain SopsisLIS2011" /LENGTH=69 /DNA_ID=CAMNT_0004514137 /DNA_START=1288 /DNA_END=1497 /DNA_ORIENTATION=+
MPPIGHVNKTNLEIFLRGDKGMMNNINSMDEESQDGDEDPRYNIDPISSYDVSSPEKVISYDEQRLEPS